ncbi:MAG: bifunctional folylpolyglutamate synthase/dihydrofolate synthase [Planctomyces sp.]|nr:bifunctional folylpolyglutamate synthase/dihydrofolate synthase [Planctomyces sp.]
MSPPRVSSPNDAVADAASGGGLSPALTWLFGRLNYERAPHDSYTVEDFRLGRMQRLLELLGDPQHALPAAHIAGTKGKGSTAAMLAAMLEAAGLRVGLFTSPHLTHYEERMTVNGRRPDAADLDRLIQRLRPAVERMDRERAEEDGPTFFELTTALGWLYFAEQAADIVVLEVGLGGRLDSTNLCRPECCIITSISRDHTRLLGETLPQIAREKAGICKPGVPVISGVEADAPAAVIREASEACGSPLLELGRDVRIVGEQPGSPSDALPRLRVDVATPWRTHAQLDCPLPGRHQARNLALAVAAFDQLAARWRALPEGAVARGLAAARWPLRIQQFSARPRILIDAAHNDASIEALCETLAGLPDQRRIAVFGTSRDKDAAAMLTILARHFDDIVLTRYMHNPRALPVDQLEALARPLADRRLHVAADPASALQAARALAGAEDLICVTGSLFLAAEAQRLMEPPST